LTYEAAYDVAIIVSQDWDFGSAVRLAMAIARDQGCALAFESAFPYEAGKINPRGIPGSTWIHIDKATYDACRPEGLPSSLTGTPSPVRLIRLADGAVVIFTMFCTGVNFCASDPPAPSPFGRSQCQRLSERGVSPGCKRTLLDRRLTASGR
jgi:hypothetical protein